MKRLMTAVVLLLAGVMTPYALGEAAPAAIRAEQERIENLRLLHRYAIQDLHDAKALAMYLTGWGGPDRAGEVETLFQQSEDLYGLLRGIDHGGMALQVDLDAFEAAPAEHLALLQRGRRLVAGHVNDFFRHSNALKTELAEQVRAQAAEKIQWTITSQPEPWVDPQHDADRQAGLVRGMTLADEWFFNLPEDTQEYMLGKAAKAGVQYADIIAPAASDWGAIETEPGQYNFSGLDAIIGRLAAHGINVCPTLSMLTGNPPQWHIDEHGEEAYLTLSAPQGRERTQVPMGVNLFHTPTGEAFARFLTAYAAHLRENWNDNVDAIYLQHRRGNDQAELEAPVDTTASMDAYWRRWSETDTPWRTPEALRAEEEPDAAAIARAEMCREQWLIDYSRTVSRALHAGWPDVRLQAHTVSDDFHRLWGGVTGRTRDLYKLAQLTANPGTKSSSTASLNLIRSFGEGRWIWMFGMHSGCGTIPAADFAQAPFFGVSRIAGGNFIGRFVRFNYPGSWFRYQDQQFGGFGMGSYIVVPQRSQELAPVILNTEPLAAEVAILWSQNSRRLDRGVQLFRSAIAMGHMLSRSQIIYDYLPEDNLADRLASYRVLILPNTQYMTDETSQAIAAWVAQGGTLLGFGAPGLFDELGNRRQTLPLAEVFGADIARMRVPGLIHPDKLETTHPEGAYVFTEMPPRSYKFETNLTAALQPNTGTARAWFAGEEQEVAIVEHNYGEGRAMLSGFPLGFEYWQSAPYECSNGLTYFREPNYNHEQKRYEQWIVAELAKLGIERMVTVPRGSFLRGQKRDDPDWFHVISNGPKYREYIFESEEPVRTVLPYLRRREGIDNLYIGLAHNEGNYFWERGYFRSTLSGGNVTTSIAIEGDPVIFDARLEVPVPATRSRRDGRLEFVTWMPKAQSSAFAVAPAGNVRLFGRGTATGITREELAALTTDYDTQEQLASLEIVDLPAITEFLNSMRDTEIVIGCGDTRFMVAARNLAAAIEERYGITARISTESPRASCRFDYMNGFGWTRYGADPVQAAILVGNFQDNGLMWKFARVDTASWMPLEINQDFPGMGRGIVALSSAAESDGGGRIRRRDVARQLVIGASYPSEAVMAVQGLIERLR